MISGVDWLFDWWPNLTCIFTGDYIYIMSDTRKKRYSSGIRMRSDNGEGFHRNSSAAYNKTGRNNNPQNSVRIRNEYCWQLNIFKFALVLQNIEVKNSHKLNISMTHCLLCLDLHQVWSILSIFKSLWKNKMIIDRSLRKKFRLKMWWTWCDLID